MSKTSKEFVKDKLNEKTGQGITLYENYLAHDTTVSIGTVVSWMEEYASLYQPTSKTDELISKQNGRIICQGWYWLNGVKTCPHSPCINTGGYECGMNIPDEQITDTDKLIINLNLKIVTLESEISSLKEQIKKEVTLTSEKMINKIISGKIPHTVKDDTEFIFWFNSDQIHAVTIFYEWYKSQTIK